MLVLRLSLVLGFFLAVAPSAHAQVLAWGEGGGELWAINLPGGDMTSVGPTGLAFGMTALARTADGRLLGLADTGSAAQLHDVDKETGAATLVVSFDQPGVQGLAVLDDGRIFFSVGTEVRELNPGDGSTQLVATLSDVVTALGDDGAMLLALTDPIDGMEIFRVDPADGQTTLINDSPELTPFALAVAVDPSGNLWKLNYGGGVLTVVSFVPQRVEDFGAGDVTTYESFAFFFGSPQAQLNSLAWEGVATLAEVPGPSPLGQMLLTLLLVSAGWFVLIRRG